MQRELILTDDGSHSIKLRGANITYHSTHGAIQESSHIFIETGFRQLWKEGKRDVRIFEMGLGSGLNALLTLIEGEKMGSNLFYEAIDLYPLHYDETKKLNYCQQLQRDDLQQAFQLLHLAEWGQPIAVTNNFLFKKHKVDLLQFDCSDQFHLIYFDAFDPLFQPELWTEKICCKLFGFLAPGGLLVTYSSKGQVRRNLEAAGFVVQKFPGPPGKREITRALRPLA